MTADPTTHPYVAIVASTATLKKKFDKDMRAAFRSMGGNGIKFKYNERAVHEMFTNEVLHKLRSSSETRAYEMRIAHKVKANAESMSGGKFDIIQYDGEKRPQGRAQTLVIAVDYKAVKACNEEGVLEKALANAGGA